MPAGSYLGDSLVKISTAFLKQKYGVDSLIERYASMQLYLNNALIKNHNLDATALRHDLAEYLEQLRLAVRMKLGEARKRGFSGATRQLELDGPIDFEADVEDETVEDMNPLSKVDSRGRRRSLLGGGNDPGVTNLIEPLTPLSPARLSRPDNFLQDDDFE